MGDFVANLLLSLAVQGFKNRSTFVIVMNEYRLGRFSWLTIYIQRIILLVVVVVLTLLLLALGSNKVVKWRRLVVTGVDFFDEPGTMWPQFSWNEGRVGSHVYIVVLPSLLHEFARLHATVLLFAYLITVSRMFLRIFYYRFVGWLYPGSSNCCVFVLRTNWIRLMSRCHMNRLKQGFWFCLV